MEPETLDTLTRLATAAEALERTLAALQAQHDALAGKVERIVAAIDDAGSAREQLESRIADLERENADLKAQSARTQRKTLPPLVTAVLAKSGLEDHARIDAALLDRALSTLPVEQRIAVKAEMARAGLID